MVKRKSEVVLDKEKNPEVEVKERTGSFERTTESRTIIRGKRSTTEDLTKGNGSSEEAKQEIVKKPKFSFSTSSKSQDLPTESADSDTKSPVSNGPTRSSSGSLFFNYSKNPLSFESLASQAEKESESKSEDKPSGTGLFGSSFSKSSTSFSSDFGSKSFPKAFGKSEQDSKLKEAVWKTGTAPAKRDDGEADDVRLGEIGCVFYELLSEDKRWKSHGRGHMRLNVHTAADGVLRGRLIHRLEKVFRISFQGFVDSSVELQGPDEKNVMRFSAYDVSEPDKPSWKIVALKFSSLDDVEEFIRLIRSLRYRVATQKRAHIFKSSGDERSTGRTSDVSGDEDSEKSSAGDSRSRSEYDASSTKSE
eukprot:173477_1